MLQVDKFFDEFNKLNISLFTKDLQEKPKCDEPFKEFPVQKNELKEHTKVDLVEEYSVVIQKKIPAKLEDPGSFTISC